METRKREVIFSATELFAEKGYYLTSVQEIATRAGVSKGSVYLYFKSKEDLLLQVITYYCNSIETKLLELDGQLDVDPKEIFLRQIELIFAEMKKNSPFYKLVAQNEIPPNSESQLFLKEQKIKHRLFYQRKLLEIYGLKYKGYVIENSITIDALITNYLNLLVLEMLPVSEKKLAENVLEKIDIIMQGMKKGKTIPFIYENFLVNR